MNCFVYAVLQARGYSARYSPGRGAAGFGGGMLGGGYVPQSQTGGGLFGVAYPVRAGILIRNGAMPTVAVGS